MMIFHWWEPDFPHHVVVKFFPSDLNWHACYQRCAEWLNSQYPHLIGFLDGHRLSDDRPFQSYDWGYSEVVEQVGLMVFFFKDPAIAAHFKLAWA